jgi:hypothetical protein
MASASPFVGQYHQGGGLQQQNRRKKSVVATGYKNKIDLFHIALPRFPKNTRAVAGLLNYHVIARAISKGFSAKGEKSVGKYYYCLSRRRCRRKLKQKSCDREMIPFVLLMSTLPPTDYATGSAEVEPGLPNVLHFDCILLNLSLACKTNMTYNEMFRQEIFSPMFSSVHPLPD